MFVFTAHNSYADNERYSLNPKENVSLETKSYIIQQGETIELVAKKYHLSVNELSILNRSRFFPHGFNNLKAGDEIDIPLRKKQIFKGGGYTESEAPRQIAVAASQAGNFLKNNPDGDAFNELAKTKITSSINNAIQQWLGNSGTARIQLDADRHFSLKNSEMDLLFPLYEQNKSLIFTQGSIHRTDDRRQANLGLGYRWFGDNGMVGGNTFIDYDLSRDHARLGIGVEYWRDYLKLSANSYLRLTNWKDSPDVEDYEERPADGWDLRAQAWLPGLPQLGGKLTYEQYYGKEVGLFGRDERQHNPHAITVGLNYTPIPLITINTDIRNGKSGKNDAVVGVEFNYHFGTPWKSQINPGEVGNLRTLSGSHYDLVERNNNIVLEYKKRS